MSKLLVAVDFSRLTDRTIEYAVQLATGSHRTIDLLHVTLSSLPAHVQASAPREVFDKIVESEQQAARAKLTALMQDHIPENLRGEMLIEKGQAAQTICRVAGDGYELVVVSTNGRTGFQQMLLGSVAERVVRYAPIPVLVVR